MKKKVFVLIFLSLIIFLIPAFIFAQEQPRVQTQKQDRVQTNINLEDQNQARLNLRERIHILEDSIIQQQERSREQEQVHAICINVGKSNGDKGSRHK